MPFLVILAEKNDILSPTRTLRASDIKNTLGEKDNTEWKPLLIDENTNEIVIPTGTIGSRWDGSGKWNIESKNVIVISIGKYFLVVLFVVKIWKTNRYNTIVIIF
jgi:nitrate reductase alpha subunit